MKKRLDEITKKRDQLNAQIQQIKARERTEERKRDTRKKILIGGIILKLVKRGDWTQTQLQELLDRELTGDSERILFDLSLSPKGSEDNNGGERSGDQES